MTMQLLPYQEFYIGTHVMYSTLKRRLEIITNSSTPLIEPLSSRKKYYGQITPDGFRIHRRVSFPYNLITPQPYHSTHSVQLVHFPPVIAGDFLEAKDGEIIIRMCLGLHWTALPGLLIWFLFYLFLFGFVFVVLVTSIIPAIGGHGAVSIPFLIFLAFILLAFICTYEIMITLFKQNAEHEKQYFLKITEGYEVIDVIRKTHVTFDSKQIKPKQKI
jgi:hypothetical protein